MSYQTSGNSAHYLSRGVLLLPFFMAVLLTVHFAWVHHRVSKCLTCVILVKVYREILLRVAVRFRAGMRQMS